MSAELERRAILAVLSTGDLATLQTCGVTVDWFTDDVQAKHAFDVISRYASDPLTQGTVPSSSYMAERAPLFHAAGWDRSETTLQLAAALRVKRLRRLVTKAMSAAEVQLLADPEAAHSTLLAELTGRDVTALMSRGRETVLRDLAPVLHEKYLESSAKAGVTGLETPFPALTYQTKGWQRGDMYVYFAAPKAGKSWLMLRTALHAYHVRPQQNVLFVTSEMPAEQLSARLVCMMYGWDFNQWRDRQMPEATINRLLQTDMEGRFHFFQPSGYGVKAIAEVRSRIVSLNMQGGVSGVWWDGHYRSAESEEHTDIYDLVRKTRAMALEPELLQPPVQLAAQEGSKAGAPTHKAYRQEASLMMYLTKVAPDLLLFQTTDVREGPSLEMEISVDFSRTQFTEARARLEGRESGENTMTAMV